MRKPEKKTRRLQPRPISLREEARLRRESVGGVNPNTGAVNYGPLGTFRPTLPVPQYSPYPQPTQIGDAGTQVAPMQAQGGLPRPTPVKPRLQQIQEYIAGGLGDNPMAGYAPPSTPFPTYNALAVEDIKAPTKPGREVVKAPTRDKGKERQAGLWAMLAGLLGGGLLGGANGALSGAIGAGQGMMSGADAADAERRRRFEDEQMRADMEYENSLGGYEQALQQIALNQQQDQLRRGENWNQYQAGVGAYNADANERAAMRDTRTANLGLAGQAFGQETQRLGTAGNLLAMVPEFASRLGEQGKAAQIKGSVGMNNVFGQLGLLEPMPTPGAPGLVNQVTGKQGYNPLLTPDPLRKAQIAEASANAALVNPRFDLDKRKQAEVERSNRAQEGLERYGIDMRLRMAELDKKVAAGQASNEDRMLFGTLNSRYNALLGQRARILTGLRGNLDEGTQAIFNKDLANTDAELQGVREQMEGLAQRLGLVSASASGGAGGGPTPEETAAVEKTLRPFLNWMQGGGKGVNTPAGGVAPVTLTPKKKATPRPSPTPGAKNTGNLTKKFSTKSGWSATVEEVR